MRGEQVQITTHKALADAVRWIEQQVEQSGGYCDVGVNFTVHGGELKRTDRTVTLKQKATDYGGHGHAGR